MDDNSTPSRYIYIRLGEVISVSVLLEGLVTGGTRTVDRLSGRSIDINKCLDQGLFVVLGSDPQFPGDLPQYAKPHHGIVSVQFHAADHAP